MAFLSMKKYWIINDILISTILAGVFIMCIAYNTFMYYKSVSHLSYIVFMIIGAVGFGIGYLISKKPIINRILYGFFSGLALVLFLSSIGLYKIGTLWFLYSMMLVLGATLSLLAYRFKRSYHFDVLTHAFLGTFLITSGLGLLIGGYPNPFLQPTLWYFGEYDNYYGGSFTLIYTLAYALPEILAFLAAAVIQIKFNVVKEDELMEAGIFQIQQTSTLIDA